MTITFLVYDLMSLTQVTELPFTTFEWAEELNAPESFTATIAIDYPYLTQNNVYPWRTAIFVDRDGVLLFGGIVTTIGGQLDDTTGDLTIGGVGFFGYFTRRYIRSRQGMTYATGSGTEVRFATVDQFRIVADLLAHAASYTGGDIGLAVALHGPSGGGLSGVTRDRSYLAPERKQIAEAISQLAACDNGFDYSVSYSWVANTPTFTLDLWYPRVGRALDAVFSIDANVILPSWGLDGTDVANVVDACGTGDGNAKKIRSSYNINDIYPNAPFPRLETVADFSDIKTGAVLTAHADAIRKERRTPIEGFTLDQAVFGDVPLGSYIVGDDVHVIIDYGYVQSDGRYRIEARQTAIDENAQETVSIDLVPLDASLRRGGD